MSNAEKLDCVIVGYNDVDFRRRIALLNASKATSAGFSALQTQSLLLNGKRHTYMELMDKAMEKALGYRPGLHIGQMPSLGSWYLWNFLVKNGYRAQVINLFSSQKEEFRKLLEEARPRVVAITTTFYIDDTPISEVARFAKQYCPETAVVVGGPHVFNQAQLHEDSSSLAGRLRSMNGDIFICDSQGELTLSRVVSFFRGEEVANETPVEPKVGRHQTNSLPTTCHAPVKTDSLASIPNLMYFADGELMLTRREIESNDLDIFSIDWCQVESKNFVPTAVTRTARSCAFSCSFCRYPVIAGPLNLKSIEKVIAELDQFQAHGVRQVVFIDDTFNVPLHRFKALCSAIAARKYDFEWYSYLRPANLDEEALDLIRASGCGGSFLGIESGDQEILKRMNKSAKVEHYLRGVKGLNERGVTTFASLIVGFPGETTETVDNTISFLEEASPTYWRAGLYFHSTDAPINELSAEYGIQGQGYSWTHNTMDWRQGISEIHRMLRSVKNSAYLPGYNFDLWGIPYLLGQGVSKAQHLQFVKLGHEMLVRELSGGEADVVLDFERFVDIFRERNQCDSQLTKVQKV